MSVSVFYYIIRYLILPILFVFIGVNFFASILLREQPPSELFVLESQTGWINPYKNPMTQFQKVGIHIHSDEVWFTPERDNIENIYLAHKEQGYDWISISDYNLVTDIRKYTKMTFDSYEYGNNLFKKHFLVIGTKEVDPDPFYIYSSIENTQWILKRLNIRKAFVVVNHPKLFHTFPPKKLENLYGYHAIEVYSPFGDDTDQWDELLKKGIPVFGMSSGDLHILPKTSLAKFKVSLFKKFWKKLYLVNDWDGETFRRFILIDSRNNEKELYQSLCNGSYLLVNKFNGFFPEFNLKFIQFNETNETFQIEFENPVKEIQFITNKNKPAMIVKNQKKASFQFSTEENFVRIEVMDLNGHLATNPVMRKNKFRKIPDCISF